MHLAKKIWGDFYALKIYAGSIQFLGIYTLSKIYPNGDFKMKLDMRWIYTVRRRKFDD
jgi:hypothetical protein